MARAERLFARWVAQAAERAKYASAVGRLRGAKRGAAWATWCAAGAERGVMRRAAARLASRQL
eukprot:923615-Prymnesium_polylepis.1